MAQLQNDNMFFDVQKDVCDILNGVPELSAIDFFPANDKDLDTEMTTALRKQGVCGLVVVNEAEFQGFESGLDTAWKITDLVVQVIENPVINRASNNTLFNGTAEDIGAKVSQVLGGIEYGHHQMFNLKKIEIGEDNNLLTSKVSFQCFVTTNLSSYVPPSHPDQRIPFIDLNYLSSNYFDKQQTVTLIEAVEAEIPTKTSELINDSGFITAHQSLSGYATEQWVLDKNYLTRDNFNVFVISGTDDNGVQFQLSSSYII